MNRSYLGAAVVSLFTLTACGMEQETAEDVELLKLPGSNFEIEDPMPGDGANLTVDVGEPGTIDWASVNETRQQDALSGSGDDSFGKGSHEDTDPPTEVTGSIPPNKSDLLNFGVYVEENASGKFLHLFWHRVQEPVGTTNMDFEFNQSNIDFVRTPGDLLLAYELGQGGVNPELFLFVWLDGNENPQLPCEASNSYPCWGERTNLTSSGAATGSINNVAIPAVDSDGLAPPMGEISARTFGEASIDLSVVFDPTKCQSFGLAYLKSRSSDSFNSALKDFIAPTPINITNCGAVTIRKVTDPAGLAGSFGFATNLTTDPTSSSSFSLGHGQSKVFSNALFGTNLTVTENTLANGFDLTKIDCSASSAGVTPVVDLANKKITFEIDDAGDSVDCTFTNRARGTIIVEKQTNPDGVSAMFAFTGDASGTIGDGGKITVANLAPGTYTSTESSTGGFDLTSIVCDDTNSSGNVSTKTATFKLEAGETVKCVFSNTQRGAILITKTSPNGNFGVGQQPHQGVPFTVKQGTTVVATGSTNAMGQLCVDSLLPNLVYTVTESVPTGYVVVSQNPQTVTVTPGASCSAGTPDAVTFVNSPLSEIEVIFRSLAGTGVTTATTMSCTGPSGSTDGSNKGPKEHTESAKFTNLGFGTYTCTVIIAP